MIDVSSDLIDDIDPESFVFGMDQIKTSGSMFMNFEGRLVPLDDNLPIGVL